MKSSLSCLTIKCFQRKNVKATFIERLLQILVRWKVGFNKTSNAALISFPFPSSLSRALHEIIATVVRLLNYSSSASAIFIYLASLSLTRLFSKRPIFLEETSRFRREKWKREIKKCICDRSQQLKHTAQLQAKTDDDDGEEENRSRSKNIKAPVIFSIPLALRSHTAEKNWNVEENNDKSHKRSFHVFMNVEKSFSSSSLVGAFSLHVSVCSKVHFCDLSRGWYLTQV